MPRVAARYHNRTKVLLCYVLAWGLALLLPYVALRYVYPYKLAGTAPLLFANPAALPLPLPEAALQALQTAAGLGQGAETPALRDVLAMRDAVWRVAVAVVTALCWALSLLIQLLWRARYVRPRQGARAAMRAVTTYRLTLLAVVALNLLGALAVYLMGVRWISGRTVWDAILYFLGFAMAPLAAFVCSRLAAPPAISGHHAFFRRL